MGLAYVGVGFYGLWLSWASAMIFCSSELNFLISSPNEILCVVSLMLWALGATVPWLIPATC